MSVASVQGFDARGTCAYCRKSNKEGVRCSFDDDSFSGFLCKTDFWRFVRLRATPDGVGDPVLGMPEDVANRRDGNGARVEA